jgi:Zn-dependent peptidase ImmA (M78 family)
MIPMSYNIRLAKRESQKLLTDFGIDAPPIPLNDIVSANGLNIVYSDFSVLPQGNEIAGFIDFETKNIYVNKDDTPNRKRFTIAHELGHYIMHPDLIKDDAEYNVLLRHVLSDKNYSPEEKEANCFAANLLVPDSLLKRYRDASNSIVSTIFAVSEDVIQFNRRRLGYRLSSWKNK